MDGLEQLVQCRSVQDLLAVQIELVRDNWQQMIENSRRLAERSVEVANEAAQKIGTETKRSADRSRRAA